VTSTQGNGNGKRILVVDDLDTIRAAISDLLEEAGYCVEEAADGDAALEAIERTHPDLVVLDLILPGRDGFDVLRKLAEQESPPPVLVMSGAVSQPDQIHEAHALGAAGYIPKAALEDTIVFRVRSALEPQAADPA